jgi:hypothetical protein
LSTISPPFDVLDHDAAGFANFTRLWGFDVLHDYLTLAKTIDAASVRTSSTTSATDHATGSVTGWTNMRLGDRGRVQELGNAQDASRKTLASAPNIQL